MAMEVEEEEEQKGEGWIVSFADLMTLLFAFFVVLWALKTEGESTTIVGAVSSIREAFVEVPDSIPTVEAIGPLKQGKFYFKEYRGDIQRKPIVRRFKRATNVTPVVEKDVAQINQVLNKINGKKRGSETAPKRGEVASLLVDDDGFRILLASFYLFEPGGARLDRSVLPLLRELGQSIKDLGKEVRIEGHTDSTPPKRGNNLELSALRASYVGKFLIEEVGIPAKMVSVGGYGDTHPVASNDTSDGRKLNRRVEIKVK